MVDFRGFLVPMVHLPSCRRADTSSRSREQLAKKKMENHTGQSGNFPKEDPPLKLIVDLCAHLADMGLEFQISLKIKDSLQFSLRSDKKASV